MSSAAIRSILPFRPHPLLRGGHLQTLSGVFLPHVDSNLRTALSIPRQHRVELSDGDVIVLHEDVPRVGASVEACVLLVHGLGGCRMSPYMLRISAKLTRNGYRVFRMDQRNSGAAFGMASSPYHAGRSEDLKQALEAIRSMFPGQPIGVAGFSLAGNMTLKLLGELGHSARQLVDCAVAVNPPVDLEMCVASLRKGIGRLYDAYFTRSLTRQILQSPRLKQRTRNQLRVGRPRSLVEFDNRITAPLSGFQDGRDYYERCSGRRFLGGIRTPVLVLASADDPLIPAGVFADFDKYPELELDVVPFGGHLGFVGRRGESHDRRWMDWRIVDWLQQHLPIRTPSAVRNSA